MYGNILLKQKEVSKCVSTKGIHLFMTKEMRGMHDLYAIFSFKMLSFIHSSRANKLYKA